MGIHSRNEFNNKLMQLLSVCIWKYKHYLPYDYMFCFGYQPHLQVATGLVSYPSDTISKQGRLPSEV